MRHMRRLQRSVWLVAAVCGVSVLVLSSGTGQHVYTKFNNDDRQLDYNKSSATTEKYNNRPIYDVNNLNEVFNFNNKPTLLEKQNILATHEKTTSSKFISASGSRDKIYEQMIFNVPDTSSLSPNFIQTLETLGNNNYNFENNSFEEDNSTVPIVYDIYRHSDNDVSFLQSLAQLPKFSSPPNGAESGPLLSHSTRIPRDIDRFEPSLEIESRPKNVTRVESPHYPWGSHSFGPLQEYRVPPQGMRWNAYFYEQAIAVVLEDLSRNLINCTLLEVV